MHGPMGTRRSIDSTATGGDLHVERCGAAPVFSVMPIKILTFAEATSGHTRPAPAHGRSCRDGWASGLSPRRLSTGPVATITLIRPH